MAQENTANTTTNQEIQSEVAASGFKNAGAKSPEMEIQAPAPIIYSGLLDDRQKSSISRSANELAYNRTVMSKDTKKLQDQCREKFGKAAPNKEITEFENYGPLMVAIMPGSKATSQIDPETGKLIYESDWDGVPQFFYKTSDMLKGKRVNIAEAVVLRNGLNLFFDKYEDIIRYGISLEDDLINAKQELRKL